MSNLSNKKKSKKKEKNSKIKFKKPEWEDFLNIKQSYCKGFSNKNDIKIHILQEFMDVYCVIKKYKPVATLNISNSDIKDYNKYYKIVNKLIDLANKSGVNAIINSYNTYKWFPHLKKNKKLKDSREMVVFHKKDTLRAILTLYVFTTKNGMTISTPYLKGKLLGYSEKNIKTFYDENIIFDDFSKYYKIHKKYYKQNIKIIINSKDYKKFKEKYIKRVRDVPTLEEMNKYLKK